MESRQDRSDCNRLILRGESVARDRIELPTRGFSVPTGPWTI